jgi:hypothetical protein
MAHNRKSSEGGLGRRPYDRRGEEKEMWVSLARRHAEVGKWGAWYDTLKLGGPGDTSPAAMAVSCWAGYHGPEMNSDNFDLFKQFQIDFN